MASKNIQMVKVNSAGSEEDVYPITKAENVMNLAEKLLNLVYPVGCVYISVTNTSPQLLFGGTWTQLENRFLLGAGSDYDGGSTGGASTVVLDVNQMPAHAHTFTGSSVASGNQSANHTHSISITSGAAGSHSHTVPIKQTKDEKAGYGLGQNVDFANRVYINGNTLGTSTAANHSHSVSGTSGNQSANHTHAVTAKGTNSNTGGGQAHNNMPPYLTVFMWKRVA